MEGLRLTDEKGEKDGYLLNRPASMRVEGYQSLHLSMG